MKKWLKPLVIIVIILFCVIGCVNGCVNSVDEAINEIENAPKNDLTYIIDKQYDEDGWAYYIEGTVKNESDKDYSYVQIDFICYDADGNNVGSALDNSNNLLAGQTWKFKAMSLDSDIDHCDYHEITGW